MADTPRGQSAHGVTGPLSGPLADFDGDGVRNFVEWAFGMNPIVLDGEVIKVVSGLIVQRGGPTVIVSGSGAGTQYWALFGRRKDYLAAGISYSVQFSADLQDWVTSNVVPTVVADDGEIEAVTVPAPATVNGKPVGFVQINIVGP